MYCKLPALTPHILHPDYRLAGACCVNCWLVHRDDLGKQESGSWAVRAEGKVNTWPDLRAALSSN